MLTVAMAVSVVTAAHVMLQSGSYVTAGGSNMAAAMESHVGGGEDHLTTQVTPGQGQWVNTTTTPREDSGLEVFSSLYKVRCGDVVASVLCISV